MSLIVHSEPRVREVRERIEASLACALNSLARRRRQRVRRMEILMDRRSQVRGNDGGERLQASVLNPTQAAKVGNQSIARLRAHSGNGQQVGLAVADLPSLAVVSDSEAV